MHSQVRRFIKTAIGFLAVGLAIGVWLIIRREMFGQHASPYESSAHVHALFVGFVMQMILGVALWLFPRPDKMDTRYNPTLVTVSYWLVTIGTAGRVVGELSRTYVDAPLIGLGIVLCGIAQVAGVLLFFFTMWSRIRPLGSKVREASGERF